jgi:hypothetical protein
MGIIGAIWTLPPTGEDIKRNRMPALPCLIAEQCYILASPPEEAIEDPYALLLADEGLPVGLSLVGTSANGLSCELHTRSEQATMIGRRRLGIG